MAKRLSKPLSLLAQRFVKLYDGDGVRSARAAGYTGSETVLAVQASRLMHDERVLAAIGRREDRSLAGPIMTRAERQAFWSRVACDEKAGMGDRLRASELLGKSQADFVERMRLEDPAGNSVPQVVAMSMLSKEQLLEFIEATK